MSLIPKTVRGVLDEFKQGALHSGSSTGPRVTSRAQAIAIALSEQRKHGTLPSSGNRYAQMRKPRP